MKEDKFEDIGNIYWNDALCKRCLICVDMCPRQNLGFKDDKLVEKGNCIHCGFCEKYCPDLAIKGKDKDE